jgi:hypothetical protein
MGLKFVNIDDIVVLQRHALEHYGGLGGIRDVALYNLQ